ncbi:MAG: O-antigen ligase domain-containing protein [Chloroflexi bacterium]|nr:MAG: O-antigen ligase domain-containing protein [Chloroflexota bacterium]
MNSWLFFKTAVSRVVYFAFGLFVVLGLVTPSWRYGPFSWWPLLSFERLAGAPVTPGVLNLLPVIVGLGWLTARLANGRISPSALWHPPGITLPLAGLTALGLASMDPASPRRLFIYTGALALMWLVYLFTRDERPFLPPILATIILIQSSVALGQFFRQGDLGLVTLGELPLNPAFSGITVLFARGTRWLRAYGLTAHPNLLGAILMLALLLLWPHYGRSRSWQKAGYGMVIAVGLCGLFVSFSRAAWLAMGSGIIVWWGDKRPFSPTRHQFITHLLPTLPLLLFILTYGDLALSRFTALNTPIESQSINQRTSDIQIALHIITANPLHGVGMGNYLSAARPFNEYAVVVHNVPLLVTAELGLPGLALWLWLILTPFQLYRQGRLSGEQIAPWVAMIVINQFDTMLWAGSNWQTGIMFGLLTGLVAQTKITHDESTAIFSTSLRQNEASKTRHEEYG